MDQRLSLITLGVRDLAASRDFYEGILGWRKTNEEEDIAFYNVGSCILSLFPSNELADDIGVDEGEPGAPAYRGFTLAQNLASQSAVDALFDELRAKGVLILKEPHLVFWGGYSGYFADPDGNAWEIAHNPFWEVGPEGAPVPPA
jgi:uncharacterized protein